MEQAVPEALGNANRNQNDYVAIRVCSELVNQPYDRFPDGCEFSMQDPQGHSWAPFLPFSLDLMVREPHLNALESHGYGYHLITQRDRLGQGVVSQPGHVRHRHHDEGALPDERPRDDIDSQILGGVGVVDLDPVEQHNQEGNGHYHDPSALSELCEEKDHGRRGSDYRTETVDRR